MVSAIGVEPVKTLNQYLPRKPFKMETLATISKMLAPGDYLTSVDLLSPWIFTNKIVKPLLKWAPRRKGIRITAPQEDSSQKL
ncbi:hypothetical protein BC940DRAFT_331175 [Gongronella butleri]|nr:hypothetical protein BC940DRAFT_331175 [Gongronella butleri]